MSKINIETYTGIYKNSVAELILRIQRDEFGIPITVEMQPDLEKIPGFYQSGKGNFWIATVDEQVIGTIGLIDIGDHNGALRKMFVDQNYRGKGFGVGQKLLDILIEWARMKGIREIFLGTIDKFIGAQRFYEKNGFIEIRKQELPVAFPAMELDVKFYKFSIKQ